MYILAFDQGTTSSRSIVFNEMGETVVSSQRPLTQYYPAPGHVEHDAEEIFDTQVSVARDCVERLEKKPECIGITNQRETVVIWEKESGRPICKAIVWQCRRTADICESLVCGGHAPYIKRTTGLPVDAYFSGTKIKWMLDNISGAREAARQGKLLCGTVDTWLVWRLTGRHLTDVTNASRTMLFDINKKCWDPKLCELLDVPMSILPRVVDNCGNFGRVERRRGVPECLVGIPITACAGDQHASLFGQTCFSVGDVKNTYGTGCFALMNTGETPVPSEKLITAIGWSYGGKTTYALEGSVFNAGSTIQWLRDGLGIISSSSEVDLLAESVEDSAGVTCVPAFTGLGAPYWDMYARASILGLTRGSSKAHICRAVLEGIAFQVSDLISEMESSAGRKVNRLYVDGGASVSRFMMQFQADILGITVDRPKNVETTALGVAMMAGIGASVLTENELSRMRESDALFDPCLDIGMRLGHLDRWKRAVETTRVYKI